MANAFLDGLLGGKRRKAGWVRAEAAGDAGPWRQLVRVEGRRWAIEDAFETAKTELGLAHNESRSESRS